MNFFCEPMRSINLIIVFLIRNIIAILAYWNPTKLIYFGQSVNFFYEVVKSILYKFNNSLSNTKFYCNIDRLIPYQIEFFSHKCVAFFIWPKKKVLEFIGIKIRLKLFKIYIEKYIISSWFVPFLFDRKKKQVLEFIGIKIRWKLSKLNNLLILVCVVYWATLWCNPNTQKKTT